MANDSADRAFDELQDILQQSILTEYPNPERMGCPGATVIRQLAERPKPIRDEAWQHVTHCSPCYREFLDVRSEVARGDRERRSSRRRLTLSIAAAFVIVLGLASYIVFSRSSSDFLFPRRHPQPAFLDLRTQSSIRGERGSTNSTRPILPRQWLDLTIDLPTGYEPGPYAVQLVTADHQPLTTAAATATIQRGTTVLRGQLDLSSYQSADYLIRIRRGSADWIDYPISLR